MRQNEANDPVKLGTFDSLSLNTQDAWERMLQFPTAAKSPSRIFSEVYLQEREFPGYPELCDKIGSEKLEKALDCLRNKSLEGRNFAIYGAGTFGCTTALLLAEAGATGTVYTSGNAPTAMRKALGILEPQGRAVEPYWLASIPFFEALASIGAPIRRDTIEYNYSTEGFDNQFADELGRTPHSEFMVSEIEEFECQKRLRFSSFVLSCIGMHDLYLNALQHHGIALSVEEIEAIQPKEGADITITALGLGRSSVQANSVDIPGNAGQIIHLYGNRVQELIENNPQFDGLASFGRPRPEGSVNIVYPLLNTPYLLIGATKNPGDSRQELQAKDEKILLNGVEKLWPELYEMMAKGNRDEEFQQNAYRCIRPGGGTSPFSVTKTNGSVDIYAAGGTGNSIAPAVALEALALGLELMD